MTRPTIAAPILLLLAPLLAGRGHGPPPASTAPAIPPGPTKQLIAPDGSHVACTGYPGPICVQP